MSSKNRRRVQASKRERMVMRPSADYMRRVERPSQRKRFDDWN